MLLFLGREVQDRVITGLWRLLAVALGVVLLSLVLFGAPYVLISLGARVAVEVERDAVCREVCGERFERKARVCTCLVPKETP